MAPTPTPPTCPACCESSDCSANEEKLCQNQKPCPPIVANYLNAALNKDTAKVQDTAGKQLAIASAGINVATEYSLGVSDLTKVLDVILPILSPYLSNLSSDQQYVLLLGLLAKAASGKTYSNAQELSSLVKSIVKQIIKSIFKQVSATIVATAATQECWGNFCFNN